MYTPVLARVLIASPRGRLLLKAQDVSLIVHLDNPELRGIVDPVEGYGGQGALLLVRGDKVFYVHIGQGVTADYDKDFIEVVRQALYASSRPQEFFSGQTHRHTVHTYDSSPYSSRRASASYDKLPLQQLAVLLTSITLLMHGA
jgi:hypothetical protein